MWQLLIHIREKLAVNSHSSNCLGRSDLQRIPKDRVSIDWHGPYQSPEEEKEEKGLFRKQD